ncbi:MAG TPA: DUF1499 domain-containing protein [Thermosynechococcaceae cyanobacterium]
MFAGKRPSTLGVQSGRLAPCPTTPNCVCSYDSDDLHKIEPLRYSSTPAAAWDKLKQTIAALERTKIVTVSEEYLYAEFTSKLMGFVDDVEFYLDPTAGAIHVRSASRLGQSDLGVNRKRIELIRSQLS